MPTYVVEKARSGRSSCKHCGSLIEEGEQRFGTAHHLRPKWWHLACAVEASPKPFKDYAKTHRVPKAVAPKKTVAKKAKAGRAPEPAMIAAMLADRDDPRPRLVFADWLQAAGDPWGEIIALFANDREADAWKLFTKHRAELEGDFPQKALQWEDGFVMEATIRGGKLPQAKQRLRDLAGLRTAVLLRDLYVDLPVDRELVELVSSKFPHLDKLSVGEGDLGALSLPVLEELIVELEDGRQLAPLLTNTHLPRLWSLKLRGSSNLALPGELITAIVESPLFRQLKELIFWRVSLASAKEAILANRAALGKLGCIGFSITDIDDDPDIKRAFKKKR
jgi:uncharacterized protein (TIGR02996 family)